MPQDDTTDPYWVVHLAHRLSLALRKALDSHGEQAGLNPTDVSALTVLLWATPGEEGLTAGELAAELGLSHPATSALLDRLTRAGLVRRRRPPQDKRVVVVHLTPRARTIARDVYTVAARRISATMEGLDAAEQAAAQRLLQAMTDALSSADTPPQEAPIAVAAPPPGLVGHRRRHGPERTGGGQRRTTPRPAGSPCCPPASCSSCGCDAATS